MRRQIWFIRKDFRVLVPIILLLSFFSIYHISMTQYYSSTYSPCSTRGQSINPLSSEHFGENKTVVMYTKYFSRSIFAYEGYPEMEYFQCSENCRLTTNKCHHDTADALVFHWRDIDVMDIPRKQKGQGWVLYNQESPENTYEGSIYILDLIGSSFDYFLSYRRDSQISTGYGLVGKLPATDSSPLIKILRDKVDFSSKSKMAAWFVSNCRTPSGREVFVSQLQKYIQVDVYGKCGPFSCSRGKTRSTRTNCYQMVEKDYFFYLSFENSLCKDYVTEKLFNILEFNTIPVVFGGANYSAILPDHSYIDARSFDNPSLLAQYMVKVSQNETLYRSYFSWKKSHYLKLTNAINDVCTVCRQLFPPKKNPQLVFPTDISDKVVLSTAYRLREWKTWWFEEAHCHH